MISTLQKARAQLPIILHATHTPCTRVLCSAPKILANSPSSPDRRVHASPDRTVRPSAVSGAIEAVQSPTHSPQHWDGTARPGDGHAIAHPGGDHVTTHPGGGHATAHPGGGHATVHSGGGHATTHLGGGHATAHLGGGHATVHSAGGHATVHSTGGHVMTHPGGAQAVNYASGPASSRGGGGGRLAGVQSGFHPPGTRRSPQYSHSIVNRGSGHPGYHMARSSRSPPQRTVSATRRRSPRLSASTFRRTASVGPSSVHAQVCACVTFTRVWFAYCGYLV